jgi:predicted nucleic acid-binding protein
VSDPARAVVLDTIVVSWLIEDDPHDLKDTYLGLIGDARTILALQTIAELRAGAREAGWGEFRLRKPRRSLATFDVVLPVDTTADSYAELRTSCRQTGHPLHQKNHCGDLWIAATAVRLGIPVVSHDAVFKGVPGLMLISALP